MAQESADCQPGWEVAMIGWAVILDAIHLLTGMIVVGGQLTVTAVSLTPPAAGPTSGTPGALRHLETVYRRLALGALVVSAIAGSWLLKYTLVSPQLLRSTSYGLLLAMKISITLALAIYLLSGPSFSANWSRQRRAAGVTFSILGSLMALSLVAISLAMRYI
jgi:uncharacterized membrane protein